MGMDATFHSVRSGYGAAAPMQQDAGQIQAVIFDMDGVLLDTESICDRTWEIAARVYGMDDSVGRGALSRCRGCNKADTLAILQEVLGTPERAAQYLERTNELFHEIETREGIALMPFALEALRYLANKGYRISLASSTRGDTVRRQLTAAKLIGFFETLTTGDMVRHSKPDGEIYSIAAASLSLPPCACVAIEDSPNGVKSAAASGMRCILIPDREVIPQNISSMAWRGISSLRQIGTVL